MKTIGSRLKTNTTVIDNEIQETDTSSKCLPQPQILLRQSIDVYNDFPVV